jgi:ABC-type multidrug transport system ATPase subunit
LYQGYRKGNPEREINEIVSAYDFLDSDRNKYNVQIWYNSTFKNDTGSDSIGLVRVPRLVNLASNAYLQFLLGSGTKMVFEFVKEMPKYKSQFRIDISSILGTLFFTWVVLQLFPVIMQALVYEKQQRLRIMMKMHGLGDGPYWLISYAYFLAMSLVYTTCFVAFGSLVGLRFFKLNDYSIQFVFYFIYLNLQVAMAFLVSTMFSNVKTATVVGYISVFGSGLLGGFMFEYFLQDTDFSGTWIIVMEIFPGFSLYRGLYEFGQASLEGYSMDTHGMRWGDVSGNGMRDVFIIMFIEWLIVLVVAYYIDQTVSSGRSPLFFLRRFQKKRQTSFRNASLQRQGSKVFVDMERPDVSQESEKVEQLMLEQNASCSIIVDNIKKVYPGRDGNPEKAAVRGLSLAVPRGECFGMLGPNGAGKTSFISMMIGLTKPTAGSAFVEGLDIQTDMDEIYMNIGVCPQHDLLWDNLTGREHLLFYGRLKNLKGSVLTQAVEESLKSLNLFHGGVADKQAGKYSGGMKRRLSVAISLIGDPKVVYMDEPSTGLDPASRYSLWKVVKQARKDRAIILTTHSMEEAEALCDRLGIFVDGSLHCIGNAKELKGRYGGTYVFTMTTSADHEEEVGNMVHKLAPGCRKIYQISGTQKFELPKHEVRIGEVFQAVESAKSRFTVFAWGLADTTLEDVFIKVARGAQAFNVFS